MPAEYSLEGGLETRVFSMASLHQQGWQSMKRSQHGLFPAFSPAELPDHVAAGNRVELGSKRESCLPCL
jgi:hypothetical protein